MKKRALFIGITVVTVLVVAGGVLYAERPALKTSAFAAPYTGVVPDVLPPVTLGDMKVTHDAVKATSLLQFDDGTCESGLGGPGGDFIVNFDVPTQCTQAGLDVVGVSAKVNSGTALSFALHQAGAAPGVGRIAVPLSPLVGTGPCPTAATMQTRAVGPGAAVVTGTANFFAGLVGPSQTFPGRDTGATAGRMWIYTTGGGVFSPTYLVGLGLGGNWMIRVTVEDANCVPVELLTFNVE